MGERHANLKEIALATMDAVKNGYYDLYGTRHDLRGAIANAKQNTTYYGPDKLSSWATTRAPARLSPEPAQTFVLSCSTLEGARFLHDTLTTAGQADGHHHHRPLVGILNFASARKPGGGFLSGASAQEESIARASTLYPTLMTRTAQAFYSLHNHDTQGGFYTHAMIYSPGVTVIRGDADEWVAPYNVDVVTCAAVNAGVIRDAYGGGDDDLEKQIEDTMRDRMGRILYLFEKQGVKHIVLGSFGTGVFRNSVEMVANIWGDLLHKDGARFQHSFDNVVFAILGHETHRVFERAMSDNATGRASPGRFRS